MLESPHTGFSISNLILQELEYLGISSKIFSITLDNVSNNEVAQRTMRRYLTLPVGENLFHVHCCAHIYNLIVQDGLHVLHNSIEVIRDIVLCINSSVSRYEMFKNCCVKLHMKRRNIPLDVPHRWNSIYLLLNVAITYRRVVDLFCEEMKEKYGNSNLQVPSDYDWAIAEVIRDFLDVFHTATKIFCSIYYPTSSRVLMQLTHICMTFDKYSQFVAFKNALVAMREKFSKYFDPLPILFSIAVVIDPRCKIEVLEVWLETLYANDPEKVKTQINEINNCLTQLYDEYKNQLGEHRTPQNVTGSSSSSSSSSRFLGGFQLLKSRRTHSSTSSSGSTSELKMYLDQSVIDFDPNPNFDILA
ncbi:zinc finger BED domain-containing protein RICESLEEPER 2-like [Tripterygium wilfordii]|uniref:zinc finger BED domain-containing protein RICESLEEPER 2-like n=1 Tax=Tripterygium wilfordii TaxID=458696 RepID=UPI0018F84CDE|nr:zinc finger BED domain-containing protein RICESLEEPER 2-like [Tripterygium wilfordii]